jgi:hypothetical protein
MWNILTSPLPPFHDAPDWLHYSLRVRLFGMSLTGTWSLKRHEIQ